MTDDIKVLLDQASSASPLKAFDIDTVLRRGRGRARRRRLGLAGGGLFGLAALTAATVALNSALAPGTGAAPGQVGGTQPPVATQLPATTYTLPELDPTKTYYWKSQGREDDATAAELTDALRSYLADNFPQLKVIQRGPEFDRVTDPATGALGIEYKVKLVAPDDEGSTFGVARYTNSLVTRRGGQPVHQQPVYRLWGTGPHEDIEYTLDSYVGVEIAVDGSGENQTDLLRFALYPAGGFRVGYDPTPGAQQPSNGYLVLGCGTFTLPDPHGGPDRRLTYDCTESTGPNGERIVAVVGHDASTVVVHRTDGTAVVVSDTPRPGINWRQGQPVSGTPGLTIEALTGLALAVPIVTIE